MPLRMGVLLIQNDRIGKDISAWIPAFAGMTVQRLFLYLNIFAQNTA
jgi:hypothetical protein